MKRPIPFIPLIAACALAGGQVFAQQAAGDPAMVSTPEAAPEVKKNPAAAVQDIQMALRDAPDLHATAVSVAVHAETVVLSGDVASAEQAAQVLSLAQKHAGGVRISSHVEVRPESPQVGTADVAASNMVREVEQALRNDRRTASLGVAVSIDDKQVVTLHGLVPSRESRAAAEEIAARVDGVQRVSSHLVVPGD
jgi:osmotically-inducible protein OsmY